MDKEQKTLMFIAFLGMLAGGGVTLLVMDQKCNSLKHEILIRNMQIEIMRRWIEAQPDPES